ncbi:DJ-1/PfpI family protein [Deinococcus pimensis]|uniref:DJ-1/PfpI family protein n=1 Tax=Deinococcus pimensis TaxID=309888 RepID=UPI0004878A70|nr:DJ-1/PfpI family protein [Deinococcus pimensis]
MTPSVAVVVFPGVLELELGAALTVFSLAGGEGTARTVARSRASIVAAGGLVTTPELMFAAVEPPGAVFVPGGPGAMRAARDPLVRTFLKAQHARGAMIAATGAGVLVLGESGLVGGMTVSAPRDLEGALTDYGAARVVTDDLSQEGGLITSPGMLGAVDAALRVVRLCWGEEREAEVSARLRA